MPLNGELHYVYELWQAYATVELKLRGEGESHKVVQWLKRHVCRSVILALAGLGLNSRQY